MDTAHHWMIQPRLQAGLDGLCPTGHPRGGHAFVDHPQATDRRCSSPGPIHPHPHRLRGACLPGTQPPSAAAHRIESSPRRLWPSPPSAFPLVPRPPTRTPQASCSPPPPREVCGAQRPLPSLPLPPPIAARHRPHGVGSPPPPPPTPRRLHARHPDGTTAGGAPPSRRAGGALPPIDAAPCRPCGRRYHRPAPPGGGPARG